MTFTSKVGTNSVNLALKNEFRPSTEPNTNRPTANRDTKTAPTNLSQLQQTTKRQFGKLQTSDLQLLHSSIEEQHSDINKSQTMPKNSDAMNLLDNLMEELGGNHSDTHENAKNDLTSGMGNSGLRMLDDLEHELTHGSSVKTGSPKTEEQPKLETGEKNPEKPVPQTSSEKIGVLLMETEAINLTTEDPHVKTSLNNATNEPLTFKASDLQMDHDIDMSSAQKNVSAKPTFRQTVAKFFASISEKFTAFKTRAKAFFASLGSKGVAQEGGKIVKSHTEAKGKINQAKVQDRKQQQLPPSKYDYTGKEALAKLNTALTRPLESSINDFKKLLSDVKANVNNPKINEGSLELEDYKDKVIKDLVGSATNRVFDTFDANKLNEVVSGLKKNGLEEEATFAENLLNAVVSGRTSEGSKAIFNDLAVNAVINQKPETFLRGTGDPGAAAIKKIIDANGGHEYQGNIKIALLELQNGVFDTKTGDTYAALIKDLESAGIEQMGHANMTEELAERLGTFAEKMMDVILNVEMPESMQKALGEFAEKMKERQDFNEQGSTLTHRLFSDQIFLKIISSAMADAVPNKTSKSSPFKVASDMINIIASGKRDGDKYSTFAAKQILQNLGPNILTQQENMFVKVGLSRDYMKSDWETPGSFTLSSNIQAKINELQEQGTVQSLDSQISKLNVGDNLLSSDKLTKEMASELGQLAISILEKSSEIKISEETKRDLARSIEKLKEQKGYDKASDETLYAEALVKTIIGLHVKGNFGSGLQEASNLIDQHLQIPGTSLSTISDRWNSIAKSTLNEFSEQMSEKIGLILANNGLPPQVGN